MSFALLARLLLIVAPLLAMLAGCGYLREPLHEARMFLYDERAEFAPPQSRWPDTLPSSVSAYEAPPQRAAKYCYRTLAQPDCYEAPNPERRTGYAGTSPTLNSAP
jgi:hypothetical protein